MAMGVERDKTGLRRCKQRRGRSQSCCLLRRGDKRRRRRRARRRPTRAGGTGCAHLGEATIEHLVPSQRSRHWPGVF